MEDKEADYIIALASGISKDKILKTLSLTEDDIEKLYKKFKLKNIELNRDIQLVTLCCMGNFISEYCSKNENKKFNFSECQELAEMIKGMKKSNDEFKDGIIKEAEKIIEEHFGKQKA